MGNVDNWFYWGISCRASLHSWTSAGMSMRWAFGVAFGQRFSRTVARNRTRRRRPAVA